MGCTKTLMKVGLFLLAVSILPGLPPYPTFPFESFSVLPPRDLEGVLFLNKLLNNAEHLLENQLQAPETIIVRGNTIYVSVIGQIIEITNSDQVRVVTQFGKECRGSFDQRECGRPTGFAFDTQDEDNLIVAELYTGLWEVKISTGEKKQLFSLDEVIEGGKVPRRAKIPDALAVAKNGDIYWSDMSSDSRNELMMLLLNPCGRLLHYSRATGKTRVLMDESFGPNGVALSADDSFVLVGEVGGQLIRRYHLKGPKAGTNDIFTDGLPGSIDNLAADETGVWAAVIITADKDHPTLSSTLAPYPILRKIVTRMISILETPFEFIYEKTGSTVALRVLHGLSHMDTIKALLPKRATVLRLSWDGQIVAALHGDDGTANSLTHAVRSGEHLLLASPVYPWIGRVRLNEQVLQLISTSGHANVADALQNDVVDVKLDNTKQEL